MTRRNTTTDPPDNDAGYDAVTGTEWTRGDKLMVAVIIAIILICALFIAWDTRPAGAVTRPDYAGLDAGQVPDVVHIEFDGHGHARVAGTNPDTTGPWLVAAFHVPNPDNWHDGQGDPTDTNTLPPGPFDLLLDCPPGAAQVDIWLEGQDQPYASAVTLDCGTTPDADVPDITPDSFPVSTPGPDATVATQASLPALAVASSEETQPTLPPAVGSPPASTLAISARAELPATGPWRHVGLLVALAAALMLAGISCCGLTQRKTRRSARVLANLRRP